MEFVLPLLFLLVGLGSIFYNPKDQNLLRRHGLGFLIILALVSICGLEINQRRESIKDQEDLKAKNILLNRTINEQKTKIRNLNTIILHLKGKINILRVDPDKINRNREERRSKIKIFYFKREHENNLQLLLKNLTYLKEKLKFKVDEESRCEDNHCSFKTNMIVFGPEVHLDDLEFIAKIVNESDVKIQVIREFQYPINKENVVHIGYQESQCKTWTKKQIDKISSLPRKFFSGNGCPIN